MVLYAKLPMIKNGKQSDHIVGFPDMTLTTFVNLCETHITDEQINSINMDMALNKVKHNKRR